MKLQPPKIILNNIIILFASYLIYVVVFFICLLITHIEFSSNFKTNLKHFDLYNHKTIALITSRYHMGETELARRLQISADKLGWQSYAFFYPQHIKDLPLINSPILIGQYIFDFLFKPKYHLALTHHANILPPRPRYMFINVPPRWLTTDDNLTEIKWFFSSIKDYDGYIDINKNNKDYELWLNKITKKNVSIIDFIVPVNATEYNKSDYKKLTVFGANNGKLKGSTRYKQMFKELDKKGYMEFYGPEKGWEFLETKSYKGIINSDGISIIKKLHDNGVGLAIHSEDHIKDSIPSTRIFEIIASGAIAISDLNPFVIKNFGDNVLYFDHMASAEDMVSQIDNHMKWILANPELAEKKASRAHQIFLDNYTGEKFLLKLDEMHNSARNND